MTLDDLKMKIKKIIEDNFGVNIGGGIEIYTDYRDRELSSKTICQICEADYPMESFGDILAEWAMDYAVEYGDHDIEQCLFKNFSEEEKQLYQQNVNECWDYIQDNFYYFYDINDFNNEVYVNIMIDCGNGNYDYTCDNVLNWNGKFGDGTIDKTSSMLWLAKTQGKATALRKACKQQYRDDGYYVDRNKETDRFVESCMQEFENLSSHMGTVTFLVKMPLLQLCELIEVKNKEYDEQGKYDPRKNTKSKSYIVLDKQTECGLFDTWNGSGSVLEIQLDKDVKVPIKYCQFCVDGCKMRGYDVDEVYGLVSGCWKESLKEVVVHG